MLTGLNYKAPLLFIGDDKLTLETSNIKSAVKKLKRYVVKGILCGYMRLLTIYKLWIYFPS